MHLSQDQTNDLISGHVTTGQRHVMMEHIIECPQCGTGFRAMRALHREMTPHATPRWWHVAFAAAAGVALMVSISMFGNRNHQASPGIDLTAIHHELPEQNDDLLSRVQKVNYANALSEWGQHTRTTDLISLTNTQH